MRCDTAQERIGMKKDHGPGKATHEEICNAALQHYESLATECSHWSSVVPKAIEFYRTYGNRIGMYEAERAYQTQPLFHRLVDMVFYGLMNGDFSVYEIRDACTLGINKYAMHKPPDPIKIDSELNKRGNQDVHKEQG